MIRIKQQEGFSLDAQLKFLMEYVSLYLWVYSKRVDFAKSYWTTLDTKNRKTRYF